MVITIPTELMIQLKANRVALAVFRKLSERTKQTYTDYVIRASSHFERQKRSRHIMKVLIGKQAFNPA